MIQPRSEKVRKILALEGRAALLLAIEQSAQARIVPDRHRAEQLMQEARAVKVTLSACELTALRRARSGV